MILKSDLINYSISISSWNWTRLIPSQIPKVEFKSKSDFFTLSGQWRESVRVMQWMKTQTPHGECRGGPHAGLLTVTRTATIGSVHCGLEYRACYILHQPETT